MLSIEEIIEKRISDRDPFIVGPFYRMTFGKYNGKTALEIFQMSDLSRYLQWVEGQKDKTSFIPLINSLESIKRMDYTYYKQTVPVPEILDRVINIGKYKGKLVSYVCEFDLRYADYYVNMVPTDRKNYDICYEFEVSFNFFRNQRREIIASKSQPEVADLSTNSEMLISKINTESGHIPVPETSTMKQPSRFLSDTLKETFDLYKSGLSIQQICQKRGFTERTINHHISTLVEIGVITIGEIQDISKTVKDTLELYRNEKSLDEISVLRSLSRQTIERHIAQLAIPDKLSETSKVYIDKLSETSKVYTDKLSETLNLTLENYNFGNSIEEIAKIRELTISTIEGHIAKLLAIGKITNISTDLPIHNSIREFIETTGETSLSKIKIQLEDLGETVSFFDIRCVLEKYNRV